MSNKGHWPSSPSPTGYRLLVIDDNRDFVTALEQGLRAHGHEVASACNGEDALRLGRLLKPDLIITDLIMPDFDPIDALSEFRQANPNVQIIAISGNHHLVTLAAKEGVHHVLRKPFEISKLALLINVMMS